MHKVTCFNAAGNVVTVTGSIQAAIEEAASGATVVIPAGEYTENVTTDKPLQLIGAGRMDSVKINGNLTLMPNGSDNGVAYVARLTVQGCVDVQETTYKDIIFLSVEVKCPRERNDDAFTVNCNGKITLNCCEIVGGSDGLSIINHATKMHLRSTDIQFAGSRGIFANPGFVIQDSAVYSCGAYGIKGRSGWTEKGENEIQPGPWNCYGGPSGGF
jgi:hypothetical protein